MNILTSYHPALLALQSLHEQFPGALEFYVFCHNDGIRTYYSEGKNKSLFAPADISGTGLKPKIQQFRQQQKNLIWGDKDDLPIERRKRQIKQLSIQDEIEQNVLIFRIHSHTDDASDVFAICFSKTFSNFYIPSGRNVLSSELKTSIGQTVRNQIVWLYDLHKNQHNNIRRIQDAYRQHADELESTQEQLEREQNANRDLLTRYVTQLVNEQEVALNSKITLKDGFLDKIMQAGIAIDAIKAIIEQAALTAYDLAIDKNHIKLTANLIRLELRPQVTANATHQLNELGKTEALLDRYEKAARQLEQESKPINGRNLAASLQISGPAVTDAIKKHNHKIKRLLEKHPERWALICDFIKPIREIKWQVNSQTGT